MAAKATKELDLQEYGTVVLRVPSQLPVMTKCAYAYDSRRMMKAHE